LTPATAAAPPQHRYKSFSKKKKASRLYASTAKNNTNSMKKQNKLNQLIGDTVALLMLIACTGWLINAIIENIF
jgi:hypothetical protein